MKLKKTNVLFALVGLASLVLPGCDTGGEPVQPEQPAEHVHAYGGWQSISDAQHQKACECGDVVKENHNWNEGVVTKNPSHVSEGEKTYTCTVCGETKTETIAKTADHDFGPWTSVNRNYHLRVCACGEVEEEAHTWDSGVVVTPATHLATGLMKFTCTKCGETMTEVIAKDPTHTYGPWVSISDTQHQKTCECGHTVVENHKWDSGTVTKEASHLKEGEMTYTCTVCHATRKEVIEKDPTHVYGDPEYVWNDDNSACEASMECACGDVVSENGVVSAEKVSDANCTEAATYHYVATFTNSAFETQYSEPFSVGAPNGHHVSLVAQEDETCTEAGRAEYYQCDNCDAAFEDEAMTTQIDDFDAWSGVGGGGYIPAHDHPLGTIIPEVPAVRENTGVAAHYVCSECTGLFDDQGNATTESDLVIPAPAKPFTANENGSYIFDEPVAIDSTITIDFKFTDTVDNSHVYVSFLPKKASGGDDWDNFIGYIGITRTGVINNLAGVSVMPCDDGYVRATFDLGSITQITGSLAGLTEVGHIHIRGAWTTASGYFEVNSSVSAHTKGDTLIPAKEAGSHDAVGYQAHYECTGCSDYWFTEGGEAKPKEEFIIKTNAVKYAPPTSGNTLAEFKNFGNITDKLWIDIHFDNPNTHQEVGFNFYESAWDNYYGTFWVDCDSNGVYFEGKYEGITLDELADGWWRVTAYPSALSNFTKDKADIDQKRSINFVYIKAPNTVSNRGSGMLEFMSDYNDVVPSTKVYSLSGKNSFVTERTFLPGDIITLDVQIKNSTQINLDLMTGWDPVCRFKVTPEGKIVDQKEGIQVFKLNNECAGYPTLTGTWYRVIVNTNLIVPMKADYKSIMRIGGNNWNEGQFDMMINSPYTTDGWYTFNGGSSATQINVRSVNAAIFRDSGGNLLEGKAVQFKVRGEGTGQVRFSLLEHDSWKNCGNMVITFANSAITEVIIQGGANKWPTYTALGDGSYAITIPLDKLPGDGFANARSVGFFYGNGVDANGLTSFGINLVDICMVDLA